MVDLNLNSVQWTNFPSLISSHFDSTVASWGLMFGSSSQHCCIRSTSLISTLFSFARVLGILGRNGGVSPLRTRPIMSACDAQTKDTKRHIYYECKKSLIRHICNAFVSFRFLVVFTCIFAVCCVVIFCLLPMVYSRWKMKIILSYLLDYSHTF